MSQKAQYKTKHRDELLSYLKTVPGEHITVNDVYNYFKEKGKAIGTTTIYRQLERMVDEGLVTKYITDNNTPACFEYINAEEHCHKHSCYHCKCEKCGQLIHLHCDELPGIQKHILEHHGFAINPMRTIFYGICEDCADRTEAEEVR